MVKDYKIYTAEGVCVKEKAGEKAEKLDSRKEIRQEAQRPLPQEDNYCCEEWRSNPETDCQFANEPLAFSQLPVVAAGKRQLLVSMAA